MSSVREISEPYFRYENDINSGNVVGPRHYHDAFEIYYLESGACNYFIDSKSYRLEAGDIVLIPERVIHHTVYSEGMHSRKLIYCSRTDIPPTVAESISKLLYLYRNPDVLPQIQSILSDIESEYSNPDSFSSGVIKAKLELLFFLLARNKNRHKSESDGSIYVTSAVEYIRDSYDSDISLSAVAKHISVSPEHLSRLFKSETGFGFCEYLTLVRLKKAEELLRSEPSLSISSIAYRCGFNDSNYFCKKFKQSYGMSPLKYKKS